MTISRKQSYHIEAPFGLLNDPNGLSWHNGFYHIFFQWNPRSKDHSYKCWGHCISEDMIHWEFCGTALKPGESYDQSGTYSGSAYVIGGELCLFYTGNDRSGDKRKTHQCLATSTDGRNFIKQGIVVKTPAEYTEHFRDPAVIFDGNIYKMIIGAQRLNGKGALAICESVDGRTWTDIHTMATSDNCEMVECPSFISTPAQNVLIYCPQRRSPDDKVISSTAMYKFVNNLDNINLDENFNLLDNGFDFYAPQIFKTPDGRHVMLGWMSRLSDKQEKMLAEDAPNIHCLTLPREVSLNDGKLYQKPIRELYSILTDEISLNADGNYKLGTIPRIFHAYINLNDAARDFLLQLGDELELEWDGTQITLEREDWSSGDWEIRNCQVENLREVEIWGDKSSVEIFINDGEIAMSARLFAQSEEFAIKIACTDSNVDATVRRLNVDGFMTGGEFDE